MLLSKGGFTLLEMLIAVSVFATAATMSAGTLLAVSDAQQKILTLRITQDNSVMFLILWGRKSAPERRTIAVPALRISA